MKKYFSQFLMTIVLGLSLTISSCGGNDKVDNYLDEMENFVEKCEEKGTIDVTDAFEMQSKLDISNLQEIGDESNWSSSQKDRLKELSERIAKLQAGSKEQ